MTDDNEFRINEKLIIRKENDQYYIYSDGTRLEQKDIRLVILDILKGFRKISGRDRESNTRCLL